MVNFSEIEQAFESPGIAIKQLKPETQRMIAEIKKIPYGQVASYKEIGNLAGLVNGGRQVARLLHGSSDKYNLPWWRVIGSDGRVHLTGEGKFEQITRLRSEGLEVSDLGSVKVSPKNK